MTEKEIIEELKRLPPLDRLAIIEATLRSLREELSDKKGSGSDADMSRKLTSAAEALLSDYAPGGEMTTFTALDHEDFHAS